MDQRALAESTTSPKPNTINYINVIAFFLTYWFSARDLNSYVTLLTPINATSLINDIIIMLQGTFTVVQMMPKFRGSHLVQRGVWLWYFAASVAQSCLVVGASGLMEALFSTIFATVLCFCLLTIYWTQSKLSEDDSELQTVEAFCFFKLPFLIQSAWVVFLLGWYISAFIRISLKNVWVDLICFHLCVLFYAFVGFKMVLFRKDKHNYVFPCVLSWAMVRFFWNFSNYTHIQI